ncbi:MAG: hypothetical protein FWE02_05390 [Defluviitaleaceae bacterium]|nr:hypothetical protein [Defluviitaleaceae bacterium]
MRNLTKRNKSKRIAVSFLAGIMAMGVMSLNVVAEETYESYQHSFLEEINFIEFDAFQITVEELTTDHIIKYHDIYFDDYGNKHETIVIFEPSYEFKKYLIEQENSIISRNLVFRESFMGNLGVNTVTRRIVINGVQQVMSFQFDLVTSGGSAIRRIQNARNHAYSATLSTVVFSNPSLNIAREYDEGSGNRLGEVNASVQVVRGVGGVGTTATWLLTARVTQSGLIRVYSNF